MPEWLKSSILRLLRVPPEPEPPAGAPGTLLVFRAAPGFFTYRMLTWALRQAVTLVGVAVALLAVLGASEKADPFLGRLLLGLELLAILVVLLQVPVSFVVMRIDYEMRWYLVTDRSLRIREGAWTVREMTMTFANVQNIEVTQGPLQRLFGIADLRVQSAGGGGGAAGGAAGHGQEGHGFNMHLGFFRGIANAQEVRDLMLQRLRRYRDAGLGDADESAAPAAESSAPELAGVVAGLAAEAKGLRRAAQALAG